jgi:hypothetical protein
MVQAQRPDLVIVDWSVHGRHRIALVELTCPWDTDAKRAKERKTARYADLKEKLSNQGWDCSQYLIKVGARGHIVKSVKDRLHSLLRAWVPAGHRSSFGQMMKDFSKISMVCSFALFQARNDPVWFYSHIVMRHIESLGANRRVSPETPWGGALLPFSPYPRRKKRKGVRALLILFLDCIDTLPIAPVGLVLNRRCAWPCCCSTSSCSCRVCPPASVQGRSVYRPRSGVRGFPYPCRKLRACKL